MKMQVITFTVSAGVFHHALAEAVGVWHKRLVNLIGCCAEGDERLLVAEYMPNDISPSISSTLPFQEWTRQVQEMLNTKKFGDIAFRNKDFKSAYSKLVSMMSFLPSGTVFVRWALSYMMNRHPELALRDAM